MRRSAALTMAVVAGSAGGACGQSLFQRPIAAPTPMSPAGVPIEPGALSAAGARQAQAPLDPPLVLEEVSLLAVTPTKPREYAENDLVQIIISERSQLDRSQEMQSTKDYSNTLAVEQFMDLVNLLETRVQQNSPGRLPALDISSQSDFQGDGEYKREDKFTDRIMARVLEVKPNGTLLLEARRVFTSDEEEAVVVLSGTCRYEDITDKNSVQSNQLYDLTLNVQNSGDLERTTRKGLIPRVLEGLLNF